MKRKQVPNGGWGWMVVLGSAIINTVNQSLFSLFGLIYGDRLKEMGYGTFDAALIVNINSMILNFSGLFTGPILKTYSVRKVAFVGITLTATGILLSSFAADLTQLILTYSIFTGIGLGLIMPSTFVAINSYFSTRKSQAVGLAMAGTGIGQMIMPQVVRFLLDEYGFQGTTLILTALCLNGFPGALLFQPVKRHMIEIEVAEIEETKLLLIKNHKEQSNEMQQSSECEKEAVTATAKATAVTTKEDKTWYSEVIKMLNLELLKDFSFVHMLLGLSMVYTISVTFNMLLPFFLQDGIGFNRSQTALVMTVLSGADILSRVTLPVVTSRLHMTNKMTFLLGTLCLLILRSILAEQTTFEIVIVVAILCGYTRAAVIVNQNLTVSEYCTDQTKLPSALGLNMVAKGIIVLSLGQLIGWVRDYSQSFSICIHVQNGVMLLVVVSWSIDIIVRKLLHNNSSRV